MAVVGEARKTIDVGGELPAVRNGRPAGVSAVAEVAGMVEELAA